MRILRVQYYISSGPVLWIEKRIASDYDIGMGRGDFTERRSNVALAHVRAHGFREHASTGLELRRHFVKHRLHDRGYARHHDYIADPEARCPRHLVEDEIGSLGHARHPHARFVHLGTGRLHPLVQDGERTRIDAYRHSERLSYAVGSDGVMGRPDTASREDIGVTMPKRVKRIDDSTLLVADHPYFLEIDPERGEVFRDIADVLILGAAGQDFIADHQEGADLLRSGCINGCHDPTAGGTQQYAGKFTPSLGPRARETGSWRRRLALGKENARINTSFLPRGPVIGLIGS